MIERKRRSKSFSRGIGDDDEFDVELGDGPGAQEGGVVKPTLEEEVDNWDENAQDWDDDDPTATETPGEGSKTPTSSTEEGFETKK
jgi:hypothetical protein